jgi:hypothetical protein
MNTEYSTNKTKALNVIYVEEHRVCSLSVSLPPIIHQFDKWHLCVSQSETTVATRITEDKYYCPQSSFQWYSSWQKHV